MKTAVGSFFLILTFGLGAQAPTPAHLPGEPHHHLKIENDLLRAYYVEVPPRQETQLHRHDHDYIFVSLGLADIVNAVTEKPEIHLVLGDGEVHFSRGGFSHVARNLAATPFRNVTIEFLKPQGEAKNLCERVAPGGPGVCVKQERSGLFTRSPLFETGAMEVDLVRLQPKASRSDRPFRNTLLVALDRAELSVAASGKEPSPLVGGGMLWVGEKTSLKIRNVSRRPSSFLEIRFKSGTSEPAR